MIIAQKPGIQSYTLSSSTVHTGPWLDPDSQTHA